jgi:spore maturation protein CgeB
MRILVAGDWHSDLHEQEVLRSLTRLGHTVGEFKWHHYFSFNSDESTSLRALFKRAQNKYVAGPAVKQINSDFIVQALQFRPDVVFVYRGTHIGAKALQAVKSAMPRCVLVGYNNDDPFSPSQPKYLWRHFMAAIPHYDLMLAYRHANFDALRSAGAKNVELLRSWYVADRNFPVELSNDDKSKFLTDVVFVGHYEADQRLDFLEEIVRQGYSLRIFGPTKYWMQPLLGSTVLGHLAPTKMVWGADYNKALCGAKVALCFLSKLNRDTYTRRCFEIPATKTLMLSEYSEDLAGLYAEGVEASYFRSKDDLLSNIKHYVNDDLDRNCVAQAGYNKVISSGHDIDSRMKSMLAWVEKIKKTIEAVA